MVKSNVLSCLAALAVILAAAPTADAYPTTAVTATTPAEGSQYQGIYLKTWSGGWTYQGILDMFKPVLGNGNFAFVTFFQTTPAGLDCSGQSPCTTVWSSVCATVVSCLIGCFVVFCR